MTDSENVDSILVDDVLLRILSFSDIRSVILASQTNRHLHHLAFSRQVWLALLSDLHARNFVDLMPGQRLHELSTTELVDLVKHMVLGPQSWSASYSSGATLARQFRVKADILHLQEHTVKLLSGGQFCLFSGPSTLGCFDLAQSKVIWSYRGSWTDELWATDLDVQVIEGGRAAVILLGVHVLKEHPENFIELLRLDLVSGATTRLLLQQAPDFVVNISCGNICDDFAVVGLDNSKFNIMVLRISTGSSAVLQMGHECFFDLIPGYFICMQADISPDTFDLTFWSMEMLLDLQSESIVSIRTASPTATLRLGGPILSKYDLAVHPSPFCEASYILWVLIAPNWGDSPSTMHKYHISHSKTTPLSIRPISITKTEDGGAVFTMADEDISYAGYVRALNIDDNVLRIISLSEGTAKGTVLDIPDRGYWVHLSPYSNAIACTTNENIVVNYYE
ncbi:hypothetical protein Hypma_001472 [Hypsizygus marmoreus]|uniref:F-box domain-containing protein n=1 Tax=Hypsizygus marmoreus TaxID=39966 RepID=A0A369K5M6_HYPMA|nr:hypothetical protein Hypma_001472 [Hypsizygus marmoreus]